MHRKQVYDWYEQYKDGIFRFALSILRDPHMAEDVLQEVFLRLLTGKRTPEPGLEGPWLYRVARNLCYDILRRKKRELPQQEGRQLDRYQYEYIEMIAGLSKKEQEIVTLKIVGGLTHREIGLALGLTEQAVKKRYERAIRKLREEQMGWN